MKDLYDQLVVGEEFGPLFIEITPEYSQKHLVSAGVENFEFLKNPNDTSYYADPTILTKSYISLFRSKYDVKGAVHAKCGYELFSPISCGQVKITGTITEKYERKGRKYIVFETRSFDNEGKLMTKETNTLLLSYS